MSNYQIYTDSACDIKPAILKDWDVDFRSLSFSFSDSEKFYSNNEMDIGVFYGKMREGGVAKTSGINVAAWSEAFEETLKEGKDILAVCFSSGLSTTYNSARVAADELREKYPERKIMVVDSLCASAGEGMLLYLTVMKKKEGATIEEAAEFAENTKLHICHWFTVDDLVYLKRGGRISPTVAFVGNTFGIKPILHVDNDGHLINVTKVRGRKKSITALVDKFGEYAVDTSAEPVFISHADAEDDAREIARQIKERYGTDVKILTDVGPVIGAHSGPGTLALFFVGRER